MALFGRYFHVYVFAAFSLGASISVAQHDKKVAEEIAPVVHEVVVFARHLEATAKRLSVASVTDEAVELYATVIRLPSLLLEHVSDAVNEVSWNGTAVPQAGGEGKNVSPVHMRPAGRTIIEAEI